MLVCNLYGSPGSGKSTMAAGIYFQLKSEGHNVELVREYAKDMVYAKRQHEMSNQVYLLAKQYKRLKDLKDYGVKIAITDSPLKLTDIYARGLYYHDSLVVLCDILNNEFDNRNFLLRRVKPYNPSGRNQTESESDKIYMDLYNMNLDCVNIVGGDSVGVITITNQLKDVMRNTVL